MRDTEKLEQMLDQIEAMRDELDGREHYQYNAAGYLWRASEEISAAIRQEQINENADFADTLEGA
jgi:hypothetical protein